MKKYLNFKSIALCAFLTLGLASCSDDDNGGEPVVNQPDQNIVQIAVAAPQLENLVAALRRADLVGVLEGDGPFTVFAPVNEAFDEFLEEKGYQGVENVPVDSLQQFLLNHVIVGNISVSDLNSAESGYVKTNADAPLGGDDAKLSLYFTTNDGIELNGAAEVFPDNADITALNGTIHIIDGVIGLPSVATFIDVDPRLEDLDQTLETNGQPDFGSILSATTGNPVPVFTVFAPTNDAFDALTELPSDDELTNVLQHHVISGQNFVFSDLEDGLVSPATLQGDALTFTSADNSFNITDGAGNTTAQLIVQADPNAQGIQAINGIVHPISAILIPGNDDTTTDTDEDTED